MERDIKLIKDAFIGKCLTVIRIKDFSNIILFVFKIKKYKKYKNNLKKFR